jgi:hypothetical protein
VVICLRRNRFRQSFSHPDATNDHAGTRWGEQKSEDRIMRHTKEAAHRKRRTKAVPVLGVAGLSFSLATGAPAAIGSANPDFGNIGVGRSANDR